MIILLHIMIGQNHFSRYLPIEPSLIDWGFYVLDAGYTEVPAHTPYPQGNHPEGYRFDWEKGRTLDEYQIVYISHGSGTFETEGQKIYKLNAGDLFLLYPGVWHRYQPNPETGWEENWIGFNGDYAHQLMERFFSPKSPVLHVGHDEQLYKKMHHVMTLMKETPLGFRQMVAGETVASLARIRALHLSANKKIRLHEEKMDEARYYLLRHAQEEVNLEQLATDLGFSYSRFRTIFKKHTGQSPLQYQLDIRVNLAKEMLQSSTKSVSEIADELGFGSVYYFSRLFKQRTGHPPSHYKI